MIIIIFNRDYNRLLSWEKTLNFCSSSSSSRTFCDHTHRFEWNIFDNLPKPSRPFEHILPARILFVDESTISCQTDRQTNRTLFVESDLLFGCDNMSLHALDNSKIGFVNGTKVSSQIQTLTFTWSQTQRYKRPGLILLAQVRWRAVSATHPTEIWRNSDDLLGDWTSRFCFWRTQLPIAQVRTLNPSRPLHSLPALQVFNTEGINLGYLNGAKVFKADGSSAGFVNDAGKVFQADGTAAGFMNGTKAFKMSGTCVGSISEGEPVLGAALLLLFSVRFLLLVSLSFFPLRKSDELTAAPCLVQVWGCWSSSRLGFRYFWSFHSLLLIENWKKKEGWNFLEAFLLLSW